MDKAAENIQHLIKWILDCYTDACRLILCCEDDADIIDSVKNRCKVIKVDPPVIHEVSIIGFRVHILLDPIVCYILSLSHHFQTSFLLSDTIAA